MIGVGGGGALTQDKHGRVLPRPKIRNYMEIHVKCRKGEESNF